MKAILKYTTAAVLAGALALAMASPSEARNGRNAAAIGGFVAGAAIGATVANSNNGYYYREPGYAYGPAYAYEPDYVYEPAPRYYNRGRAGGRVIDGQRVPSCASDGGYGRIDYGAC